MSGYRKLGFEDAIPEVVSGHAPDGTPTRRAHVAIVPRAFARCLHTAPWPTTTEMVLEQFWDRAHDQLERRALPSSEKSDQGPLLRGHRQ